MLDLRCELAFKE